MLRSFFLCCLFLAVCQRWVVFGDELSGGAVRSALAEHCVHCHGREGEINGEVDLLALEQSTDWKRDPHLLQRLIDVIERRDMPPADEAPLPAETRRLLLNSLQTLWQQAITQPQWLGQAPIRRMNRFQYHNAVTDLFSLNCAVFTLPERMLREHKNYFQPATGKMADTVVVGSRPLGKSQLIEPRLEGVAPFPQDLRAEHGFDNQADHLSLSPLLMEAFLKLGQSITHSLDFTPSTVGIWAEFFAPPAPQADIDQAVRSRLQPFLTRAFRQPVTDRTLDRYTTFVTRQIAEGVDFTSAMRAVAAAVIASPKFLYLYDQASGDAGAQAGAQPLNDWELATRLSFFLWGTIPDQELAAVAAAGQLGDDQVLTQQLERMLRDERLKGFCDSFPAQWLQLERIISSLPDPQRFPEFYFSKYRASMHMMVEPLLLFETVLIENQSITQLLDADFTYRSQLLRELYGEELTKDDKKRGRSGEVTTMTFHRLPVTDRRYGGVITNAAVMTMTSGRQRTQPITRGAWLATVIFNDPPPPPPANVPALDESPAADQKPLTLREQLALHRERADCRGCHERIDPLGFALENYDPIGAWREHYDNGRLVEVAGSLFHQHHFENIIEFKQALLLEKDRFARGFVGHLLAFALARPLEPADALAMDKILENTAPEGYLLQSLIKQIVLSAPFRHKYNPPTNSATSLSAIRK